MKYLIASFICTNALHGWLVFIHRGKNPASLSYHTIKNRRTLFLYFLCHLAIGALLILFVLEAFTGRRHFEVIFVITLVASITEWGQAALPAKGKTDIAHTISAGIMSLALMLLVLMSTLFYAPSSTILYANLSISALVFAFTFFVRYPPRKNFWKLQFIGQILLYLQMFLLLY